jgi:hypothetical protein
MTRQAALKICQGFWGKSAAVQMTPRAGRVGFHGEYLPSHGVSNAKGSPKIGRYRCAHCSDSYVDDRDDLIIRDVWHTAGGWQTAYKIGILALGMFFEVRAEADSFEAAITKVEADRARKQAS